MLAGRLLRSRLLPKTLGVNIKAIKQAAIILISVFVWLAMTFHFFINFLHHLYQPGYANIGPFTITNETLLFLLPAWVVLTIIIVLLSNFVMRLSASNESNT